MSVNIGSTNIGRICLGSTEIAEVYLGSTKIFGSAVDPYNPLGLPQYTIRARFASTPAATSGGSFSGTITNVSGDIYDIQTSNWNKLFGAPILFGSAQIDKKPVEVLGANCTDVTSMNYTFYGCSFSAIPLMDTSSVTSMFQTFGGNTSLTSVPLFDTSNVTDFTSMFEGCTALTSAPAFNMSSATTVSYMFRNCGALTTAPALSTGSVRTFSYMFQNCTSLTSVPQYTMTSATQTGSMFYGCTSVSSGALSLYNSVSQQASPPTGHADMFRNCGANTTNGIAELKQIPGDWGGRYGELTCEKYYYSSASTDLAAYTPRAATGYLAGAIWTPTGSEYGYTNSVVYSIKTPATAGTMRIYPTSRFYKWNTSTTQSSSTSVQFGVFTIPKGTLSRQAVYSSYYGWKSVNEPQFVYRIASAGTAPSTGYNTYTPPVNTTYNITSNFPSIPATWTILLCLYIYVNNTYYFGTVARNTYGYLPYTSNDDLIVQVSDATPLTGPII